MHDNIKKQKRIFSVPKFKIQYERNDGEIIKKKEEREKIRYFQKLNLQNKPIKKSFHLEWKYCAETKRIYNI